MINYLGVLARTGFDTIYLVSTSFQYFLIVKAGDGKNFPIATCKVLTFQPTLKHDFFQPHDEDSLASAATETYITFIHKLESNCKDQ